MSTFNSVVVVISIIHRKFYSFRTFFSLNIDSMKYQMVNIVSD